MIIEYQFLIFLVLTTAVELPILYLLVRYHYKIGKKDIPTALLIFSGFVSFATLPYVWFVIPKFITDYTIYVIVAEAIVWIIEAVFYYFVLRISFKKSAFLSFVCNLISTIIGLLIVFNI